MVCMKLVKKNEEGVTLEIDDLTLINMLHETIWKKGGVSAYGREHIYLAKPQIWVKGKNARKILEDAANTVLKEIKEFKEKLKKA